MSPPNHQPVICMEAFKQRIRAGGAGLPRVWEAVDTLEPFRDQVDGLFPRNDGLDKFGGEEGEWRKRLVSLSSIEA